MQTPKIILSIVTTGLLIASSVARADERDDKIKAMQQQIQAQEDRIRRLEEMLTKQQEKPVQPAQLAQPAQPVAPQQAGKAVQPEATNAPPEKSRSPALVSIGEDGFKMQSPDGAFALRLGGILQTDMRSYFDDGGIQNNDMFLMKRTRMNVDGKVYRDFTFRIQPEFGGSGSPSLRDAYLNYSYAEQVQVKFGKFKVPVGLWIRHS